MGKSVALLGNEPQLELADVLVELALASLTVSFLRKRESIPSVFSFHRLVLRWEQSDPRRTGSARCPWFEAPSGRTSP